MNAMASLGDLVAERPARARVMERYGLDYCCGGRRSLSDACREKALDRDAVVRELEAADRLSSLLPERDWRHASLTELADHIEATHHAYLKAELPRLSALLEKVDVAHGERHPWLRELIPRFDRFRTDLERHLWNEESILFPLFRQLDSGSAPAVSGPCLSYPIDVMKSQHDDAGAELARFRTMTDDYTPPEGACNTFRALMDALAMLERDMHRHVHLENNILFARAIARVRSRRAPSP